MNRIFSGFTTLLLFGATWNAQAAEPAAVEAGASGYTHEELLDVPEPLFFDLIRRPGAHAGEIEVNVLAGIPLRSQPRISWSPEIEYAFARGHAIELEFDVDHDRLERVQLGFQGTFGFSSNQRFIHGWQMLAGYGLAERNIEFTGLYMFAVRFTHRLSSWLLIGPRVVGPIAGEEPGAMLVLNPSLYLRLRPNLNLAIESTILYGKTEQVALLLGEVEWDVSPSVQLQLGLGPRWENGVVEPFLTLRTTWDRD